MNTFYKILNIVSNIGLVLVTIALLTFAVVTEFLCIHYFF